jgi:hypothetical protein
MPAGVVAMSTESEFDRAEGEAFLQWLDPESDRFTFQTIDNSPAKREELGRTFTETLDKVWPTLCEYSRNGCGIYVTINRTDLKGRKERNVTAVRALFADLDKVPATNLRRLPLKPQWAQRTSKHDPARGPESDDNRRKIHAFWKVEGVSLDEFPALQKRLAELLGSDPTISDLPRVMRLPGFLNRKPGQNCCVRRMQGSDAPKASYSREEFIQALEDAEERRRAGKDGLPAVVARRTALIGACAIQPFH